MQWKFTDNAPIYSQLMRQLTVEIVSGGFSPGERLPSVRDMALEAGVNPNTIQRALTELERDGLVYSQRTAGRFVTEDKTMIETARAQLAHENVAGFIENMVKLGYCSEEIIALIEEEEKRGKEENGDS